MKEHPLEDCILERCYALKIEDDKIKYGDLILLFFDERRNWIIKVDEEKKFHTHLGIVDLDSVVGKKWGSCIESSLGKKFYVFYPSIGDLIVKIPRRTNIIYPKDAGLILLNTGIGPGSRVAEAGSGSGALTSILAYYVRPTGHVYSYEVREDFIKLAKKNVRRLGLSDYVTFKNKDIKEGIDEENLDAIILDLATPWDYVKVVYDALSPHGMFVSFSPTIDQVIKTYEALSKNGFRFMRCVESFLRDIIVRPGKTRPSTRMIGHTGYILFARKISQDDD
ncbi:MAG: tRNA (adenine-N1)-methyltransferase [Candidatus Asgardarchaeia archaeon]